MITIIQGESYPIPVVLQKGTKNLGPEDVADVQICIAGIHQKYAKGELTYDDTHQRWVFFPTQDDTLAAEPGITAMQVQIKYKDGQIRKIAGPYVSIQGSPCKEKV